MRTGKRNWFSQAIEAEKREMLPLNFTMSYRVVPIYALISFLLIAGFGILLAVDETKYFVPAMVLMGVVALISIALLASLPFVRKRAIQAELARYCFDVTGIEADAEWQMPVDGRELHFDHTGVRIDGVQHEYSQLSCRLSTNNYCKRVRISLWILPPGDEEGILLPLTARVLKMLTCLPVPLENPELLEYILRHKEDAFCQIYDKGFVRLPD